jgi:uncharacterized protein
MPERLTVVAALLLSSLSMSVATAREPTVHEIYDAAEHGKVREAEAMVQNVLAAHPDSAKAHYVASEVYARGGKRARARAELSAAEKIDPGLSFADPKALANLRKQLGEAATTH